MKTLNTTIETADYNWPYSYSNQPMFFSPDDDDDNDDDDESGDWGIVDPLEHPGQKSDMDPSAPGSAV